MQQVKGSLRFNYFATLFKQFNISYIYSLNLNRMMNFSKLYSTAPEVESIPLDNLKDLKLDNVKCDAELWQKIVDEITDAKHNKKVPLPSTLKLVNIKELTHCGSYRRRLKYLNYLFKIEMKTLNKKEKKLKKKMKFENSISVSNDVTNHIQYGLSKNTLLLACRKKSGHRQHNNRLANSIIFGPKIVFDLDYDEFMWKKERSDCAAQLRLVYSINRKNLDPYDMYFCNAKPNSFVMKYLRQEMPNIDETLLNITEKSYTDIFPKENLVYLSPHASESLKTYDHSAVYIIGGFVDTVKREHISLHKSQNEGIRSYSLPLDDYVLWGEGSKSLSINQVFSIMMTLRDTGDWKESFKHIPSRKIRKLEPDSDNIEFVSDKIFLIRN